MSFLAAVGEDVEDWLSPITILIVDDSEPLRRVLARYLERYFCRSDRAVELLLLEAEDGCQATMIVTERHSDIDLVITDMDMPIMDGLTFFQKVKDLLEEEEIPVWFVTASDDFRLPAGNVRLIVKPYNFREEMAPLLLELFGIPS